MVAISAGSGILHSMLNLKGKQMATIQEKYQAVYGMQPEDIQSQYMQGLTAKVSGLEMVVMGILSDCQELGAMGRNEDVRKQLNVAKYILSAMLEAKTQ